VQAVFAIFLLLLLAALFLLFAFLAAIAHKTSVREQCEVADAMVRFLRWPEAKWKRSASHSEKHLFRYETKGRQGSFRGARPVRCKTKEAGSRLGRAASGSDLHSE
jgi:hypothetical protein